MSKTMTLRFLAAVLVAVCVSTITQLPAGADELAARFHKPPDEARPLTWWHWLDGNVTREGITADGEAIQRAGLGGAYLFNCGVGMPQGDVRFMQPKWA